MSWTCHQGLPETISRRWVHGQSAVNRGLRTQNGYKLLPTNFHPINVHTQFERSLHNNVIHPQIMNTTRHIVTSGGKLFEYFMMTCSGYSENRKFLSIMENPDTNQHECMEIVQKNVSNFVGWLIFHICSVGTNGRRQQFYHTFVSHYFGLSRMGIDGMHSLGYSSSLTMFDSMRKIVLQESIDSTM